MTDSRIACLGWGSLIWDDARPFPVREDKWFDDGPSIPVEFARQSKNGRLTLVIIPKEQNPKAAMVTSLWAWMNNESLPEAREALKKREECKIGSIHYWPSDDSHHENIPDLAGWANTKDADYVIWTGLLPKFKRSSKTSYTAPNEAEAVCYLDSLRKEGKHECAEEYIRKAPSQIDTPFRKRFVAEFGWTAEN